MLEAVILYLLLISGGAVLMGTICGSREKLERRYEEQSRDKKTGAARKVGL